MNKISHQGFIKIPLRCCRHERCDLRVLWLPAMPPPVLLPASTSGAAGQYIPGTYEGTAEGISSTVQSPPTFSDSAVDVVVDTSGETASFWRCRCR